MSFVGTAAREYTGYVHMTSPSSSQPSRLSMCCPGRAGEVHFAGLHKTVAVRLLTQKMEQATGTLFSLVAVPATAPVAGPILDFPQANIELKHIGAHTCVKIRVTWVRSVSVSTESNTPGWDFCLEPEIATLSTLLLAHLEQISVVSDTLDQSPDPTSKVRLSQQQIRSCLLQPVRITDEQREKIQKNRLFALEVRRKRSNQPLQLATRNAHPLDARITFDETEHVYTLDQSIQFPVSVSGVWARFFAPMDMVGTATQYFHKWAADTDSKYHEFISSRRKAGLLDDVIVEAIVAGWRELGSTASRQGTYMHRQIELYLNGEECDETLPEMKQLQQFLQDFAVPGMLVPFRTEWSVFDERRMVAGQIDCIFKHSERSEFHMVDWKRCAKLLDPEAGAMFNKHGLPPCDFLVDNAWSHYAMQQNIYAAILADRYGMELKSIHLLQLHEKQTHYNLIPIPFFKDVACEMLDHYAPTAVCQSHAGEMTAIPEPSAQNDTESSPHVDATNRNAVASSDSSKKRKHSDN